jgi:hypothetical protein
MVWKVIVRSRQGKLLLSAWLPCDQFEGNHTYHVERLHVAAMRPVYGEPYIPCGEVACVRYGLKTAGRYMEAGHTLPRVIEIAGRE